VSRRSVETEAQNDYALAGMAGGIGALFSAPLFGAILVTELSPTPKKNYVAAFIPQFTAATVGYLVFFGVTGSVFVDSWAIPGYQYENVHLLYAVFLGLLSVLVLLGQALIGNLLRSVVPLVGNPYVRGAAAGAVVGLIAFALPLTATGGSEQLAYETANPASFGVGLLVAVLVGKMVAFTLSQEAGFLGGAVFPVLFIGGTAGVLVHVLFPDIPVMLAVAAMLAAVPGAVIGAPVSFILVAISGVGLGVAGVAPVGIAVITAHLAVWSLEVFKGARDSM
jgi:H+/Cl- antiporter ClcA